MPRSARALGLRLGRRDHPRRLPPGFERIAGCVVVISHDRWFLDGTVRRRGWAHVVACGPGDQSRGRADGGCASRPPTAGRVAVHTATHILAFEGDSKVTFFDGNFSEYESWRRSTLGDEATKPHRITYRRLTR